MLKWVSDVVTSQGVSGVAMNTKQVVLPWIQNNHVTSNMVLPKNINMVGKHRYFTSKCEASHPPKYKHHNLI